MAATLNSIFFEMDRHEWGAIHLYIGFILLGLLLLHIILHWKVITCVYNRIIEKKLVKNIVAFAFIIISTLLIVIPLLVNPKVEVNNTKVKKEQHTTDMNSNKERGTKTIAVYENEPIIK